MSPRWRAGSCVRAALLGSERGIVVRGGEDEMHAGGHFAQPPESREERWRVGEGIQRLLPAVARTRNELLHDAERGREPGSGIAVPAEQRRRMPEAARVQEAEHLELRALAALEATKRLEDAAFAEHDRAVGLLAADRPHRLEGRLGGQRGSELELDAAGFGRQARRAPQGREQRARKRRDPPARARSRRPRRCGGGAGRARCRRRRTRPRTGRSRTPAGVRRCLRCGRP